MPPVPAGPPPPRLGVGTAMSYGWNRFREHAGRFILMMLVVAAISTVVTQVSFFIVLPMLPGRTGSAEAFTIAATLTFGVVVAFFLQAGVYRAGLAITEGHRPDLAMLIDADHIVRFAATVALIGLGAYVGIALCVIPGIVWLLFTGYAPIISLDQGVGPLRAIRRSIEMIGRNSGTAAPILVVAFLTYWSGVLLCGVGILMTGPVALVAVVYSYRWIRDQGAAS